MSTGSPRVLLTVGRFARPGDSAWLFDDLASSLLARGLAVDVVVHDVNAPRPRGWQRSDEPGLRVFSVGPAKARRGVAKFGSYLATLVRLRQAIRRFGAQDVMYDLGMFSSVACLSGGLPGALRRRGRIRSLTCVVWDFFPIHHIEIGRLPRLFHRPLKAIEARSIGAADVVAVMSHANHAYLRRYHQNLRVPTTVVPPWSADVGPTPKEPKSDRFTIVFGGQLEAGRGVDTVLEAAARLGEAAPEIRLRIAGSGRDEAALRRRARELALTNVEFVGRLPRPDYLRLLAESHVGVAATVAGVSVPTFPSKIGDYARMGLPLLLCLEQASDVGDLVRGYGAGEVVAAGDANALAAAAERLYRRHLAGDLDQVGAASRSLFESELSVAVATARLLGSIAAVAPAGVG